ncbi:MAG: hypothetical protein ACOWWM_12685 [Desulfobacterales bacterium]
MKKILFLAVIYFCLVGHAAGAIVESDTCSYTDVNAALTLCSDGDELLIPPGECTWDSSLDVPNAKTLIIRGSGSENTIITSESTAINLNESGSRVTGIGFIKPLGAGTYATIIVQGTGWRIDNCSFNNATGESRLSIEITGINTTTLPEGLIDNNSFTEGRVVVSGMGTFAKMSLEWASASRIGSANNVFIEDNVFYKTVWGGGNVIDANRAASYVARFNSIGGSTSFMAHSLQSDTERGTRSFAVYNNTFELDSVTYTSMFMRSGAGYIFANDIAGLYTSDIVFDNVRSFTSIGTSGLCDGDSDWDANDLANGWACRDQIGRGVDAFAWTVENPYPSQASAPIYLVNNRVGETIASVSIANSCDDWIQSDRDYYNEASSFDGSTGVGTGTYAEMQAITPTTDGVGFWVTDRGDWNLSGDDGQLWVWNATAEEWQFHYEPYQYPHPLRNPLRLGLTPNPAGIATFGATGLDYSVGN